MPEPALATHPGAGSVAALRLAARFAEAVEAEGEATAGAAAAAIAGETSLGEGEHALGPLRVRVARVRETDPACAGFDVTLENAGPRPLHVASVVLGFRWTPPPGAPPSLRFLRHGWQSWSFTGARELDERGEPPFPSGPWLRGLHHALGAPPPDRAGWHESELLAVAGASPSGPACLVAALERGRAFGIAYLRRAPDGVRIELEQWLDARLAPGARHACERVRVAVGSDAVRLLEACAEAHGRLAGARTARPFVAGWCSWYHFFERVDEGDVLRNLEALASDADAPALDVVQLDDGWQRAVGDWLACNEKFPRGLAPLAAEIRAAGFTPGLWTAPFCAVPESRLFAEHPDWLLRRGGEPVRALLHPVWSADASVHGLDASREDVREHLRALFGELVATGFRYHKLDFLYAAAVEADASDPAVGRAERLRAALEAVRAGAGEEAFLLGCGCPLGAAVGVLDGMRIGPDVAPRWDVDPAARIPGIEAALPSTRSAVRSVLARSWMHRRLWLNDPDCLMARHGADALSPAERRTLAASIAATGGMLVFSDDWPKLDAEARALVRETLALAREVDAAGIPGAARARDLLADELAAGIGAALGDSRIALCVNAGETPRRAEIVHEDGAEPAPLLGSTAPRGEGAGRAGLELAPHDSALLRLPRRFPLAVFCDFDGTFSVQDVGATLAQRWAPERRPAQWARYERGEITAWEYNLEILDGLALPLAALEEFLAGVELDPGAAELVAWCEAHGVPFRVLSDGFDYNLNRLQVIHGVRFGYDANHLRYEDGRWRIRAGHPNPDCPCGTGTCKRGRIEAFRAAHPGVPLVHVGNGRVSDLCGALAADRVFAKDSLAEELARRGEPHERFATLHDVREALARAPMASIPPSR